MFNIYLAVSNFLSRLVAIGDKCNSPLLRTTMEYLSTAFGDRSKLLLQNRLPPQIELNSSPASLQCRTRFKVKTLTLNIKK